MCVYEAQAIYNNLRSLDTERNFSNLRSLPLQRKIIMISFFHSFHFVPAAGRRGSSVFDVLFGLLDKGFSEPSASRKREAVPLNR